MNLRKRMLSASAIAMLLVPNVSALAQNTVIEWQPRTVAEIKKDLVVKSNKQVEYTVRYGDTLSAIAAAIDVDVKLLGEINQVANLDLIFPDTILTTSYDKAHKADTLTIQTPKVDDETTVVAQVDLKAKELEIGEQTISLAEPSQSTTTVSETVTTNGYLVEKVEKWAPVQPTPTVTTERETTTTVVTVPHATERVTEANVADTTTSQATTAPVSEPTTTSATTYQTEAAVTTTATTAIPETSTTTLAPETTTTAAVAPDTSGYAANGLRNDVEIFRQEVANLYGITEFSTYRPGDPGDHGKGLAVDFMVPVGSDLGDQVAQYAIASMGKYHISYVIWKQQIYGNWNPVWTMMEDRGSVTQNHYDHVHVSFE